MHLVTDFHILFSQKIILFYILFHSFFYCPSIRQYITFGRLYYFWYYFWYDHSIQYPLPDIIKLHYKILSVLKLCKSGVQLVPGLSLGFIMMLRIRESDFSRIHMLLSEIMANSESLLSLWPFSSVVRWLLPDWEFFPNNRNI